LQEELNFLAKEKSVCPPRSDHENDILRDEVVDVIFGPGLDVRVARFFPIKHTK
jgi:hypothetical protein